MKTKMIKKTNPLISVLIPTYNNGKYIKQAIESVYAQNYDNIEIIVVDDGSTDNTKEIVEKYKDIKYFYTKHKGIPFVRNLALEKSHGEYIAFLDSDDYWLPEKLNTQIQYFKNHSECEIVFTKHENFFEEEKIKTDKRAIHEKKQETIENKILPSALIKKRLFEKYGVFDENFQTGEDTELIYRMTKKGVSFDCCIDKVLYMRRLHGNNITLIKNPKYLKVIADILRKEILNK